MACWKHFLKRKHVVPVAVLHLVIAGSVALAYLGDGRFNLPKDPAVLDVTALSQAAQEQAVSKESSAALISTHAQTARPQLAQNPMSRLKPRARVRRPSR
jgi:hypothetical protein